MRLHLFGDSVFRGEKTDIWSDPAPSLRELQSPAAVINLVAGRPLAVLAGPTGLPDKLDGAETHIRSALASGAIASGDVLAFLDVGPHAMDTARHEADWLRLRRAATADHDVRLIMCSGFDHGARGKRDHQHEAALDGRSPNDAVRAAALAPGRFVGATSFLDVAAPLKALHAAMKPRFGLSPYFRDCVHLTVWGQIFLALLILDAVGEPPAAMGRLVEAVTANVRRIGAASTLEALEVLELTVKASGVQTSALGGALARARVAGAARRTLRAFTGERAAGAGRPEARELVAQAHALAAGGSPDEALALFRRAAALDEGCVEAHRGWIEAAARAGRAEEVIEAGRAALALAPSAGKYYVWLAEAMLAQGADPELVAWLDASAEAHQPPRAFKAMAELTAALGDPARAKVWSDRVELKWRRQAG